jgi:hypothetical protein
VVAERDLVLDFLDASGLCTIPKSWKGAGSAIAMRSNEWGESASLSTVLQELEEEEIAQDDKTAVSLSLLRNSSILAGCDYLSGLPHIGIRRAVALFREHRTTEKVGLGVYTYIRVCIHMYVYVCVCVCVCKHVRECVYMYVSE